MVGLDNPERNAVATIPVTLQRSRGPQARVFERLQRGFVEALLLSMSLTPIETSAIMGFSQRVLRGLMVLKRCATNAETQTKASARSCIVGTVRSGW